MGNKTERNKWNIRRYSSLLKSYPDATDPDIWAQPHPQVFFQISVQISADHPHPCYALLYRIQWLGYKGTDEEFAWLPATKFSADNFIEDLHHHYPDKPGPLAKVTIQKSTI